jgi:hypothetical protein
MFILEIHLMKLLSLRFPTSLCSSADILAISVCYLEAMLKKIDKI